MILQCRRGSSPVQRVVTGGLSYPPANCTNFGAEIPSKKTLNSPQNLENKRSEFGNDILA
jgi:hypothetical protein